MGVFLGYSGCLRPSGSFSGCSKPVGDRHARSTRLSNPAGEHAQKPSARPIGRGYANIRLTLIVGHF